MNSNPSVVEICAGAGGQSLGLERAGFSHSVLVEIDSAACSTLRRNRPGWHVQETDVHNFDPLPYSQNTDLLAGGVPCPPFSLAGKGAGPADDRDLFPRALELAAAIRPRGIMLENVRGFASKRFDSYRNDILQQLQHLGYVVDWRILTSADFGVPQLRPRFVLVALRPEIFRHFQWPLPTTSEDDRVTVGSALRDQMAAGGWSGAFHWAANANKIAPTLVGGSRKHGGADLGPSRARHAWKQLGVIATSLSDHPFGPETPIGTMPRLTVEMAATIQGFPPDWVFTGRKTARYRQIGNAFPPPVAEEVGKRVALALCSARRNTNGSGSRCSPGLLSPTR